MSSQPVHTATPDTEPRTVEDLLRDWTQAVETQTPVGTCRQVNCDGTLRANPAMIVGGVVFLEGECDACHREVAMPNGKRAQPHRAGPLALVRRVDTDSDAAPDHAERAFKDW